MKAKTSLVGIIVLFLSSTAFAASASQWSKIVAQLDKIPSAAGVSVAKRLSACADIKIQRAHSWMEVAYTDAPDIGAKTGDTIIEVWFDAKLVPDSEHPEAMFARWVIKSNQAIPAGGWAEWFQKKPFPIGSVAWMNC